MTIPAALNLSRIRNPHKPAIVFGDRSWTYAEFDELTTSVARNLLKAGLEPGDRVALHLLNGPELALGYIGCLKAAAIAVPINTRLKGPEIDYILRQSGSACYIGQPDLYDEAARSCPAMMVHELRYLTGDTRSQRFASFEDLLCPTADSVSLPTIAADQIAVVFYTSGTTARPERNT